MCRQSMASCKLQPPESHMFVFCIWFWFKQGFLASARVHLHSLIQYSMQSSFGKRLEKVGSSERACRENVWLAWRHRGTDLGTLVSCSKTWVWWLSMKQRLMSGAEVHSMTQVAKTPKTGVNLEALANYPAAGTHTNTYTSHPHAFTFNFFLQAVTTRKTHICWCWTVSFCGRRTVFQLSHFLFFEEVSNEMRLWEIAKAQYLVKL